MRVFSQLSGCTPSPPPQPARGTRSDRAFPRGWFGQPGERPQLPPSSFGQRREMFGRSFRRSRWSASQADSPVSPPLRSQRVGVFLLMPSTCQFGCRRDAFHSDRGSLARFLSEARPNAFVWSVSSGYRAEGRRKLEILCGEEPKWPRRGISDTGPSLHFYLHKYICAPKKPHGSSV